MKIHIKPRFRSAQAGQVQLILVIALFVVLFSQGAISEYILGTSRVTSSIGDSVISRSFIEILIFVNVLWLVFRTNIRLPKGWMWFVLFVTWSLISGLLIHNDSLYSGFLYGRYTLYALSIYTVAWNCQLNSDQLRTLGKILASLFIIQIVSSVVTGIFLGDRAEWRVGTMSVTGGELAGIFPILGLGYALGWYLYVKRSLWVLLLALSFGIVGYSSGKRVIYMLFPAMTALNGMLYFSLRKQRRTELFRGRQCISLLVCGCIFIFAAMYGMMHSTGFDAAMTRSNSISEMAAEMVRYVSEYEQGNQGSLSTGRVSTTKVVADSVGSGGVSRALLGWGPKSFLLENGYSKGGGFSPLGISYGIAGWAHATIAVGVPGAVFYLLAYASILIHVFLLTRRKRLNGRSAAIAFGTMSGIIGMLYCYIGYGSVFMFSGWITFPLVCCAGIVLSPMNLNQVMMAARLRREIVYSSTTNEEAYRKS